MIGTNDDKAGDAGKSAFDLAAAILAVVADPEGCKARLAELQVQEKQAISAVAEAAAGMKALSDQREGHAKQLAEDRAAAEREINGFRNKWTSEWDAREKLVRGKEARSTELLAKAETDSAAAAKLRAEYEDRMQKLHALAS
jgi:hypothetical protein